MMLQETEIQDSFNKAADLIEKEGWIKGQYISDKGYCMLGAVIAVDARFEAAFGDLDPLTIVYIRILEDRIKECTPEDRSWLIDSADGSVVAWNDSPDRTKEQVLAVLRGQEC